MNLFSLLIFSLLHILKISATPKCPEFFQCGNLGLLRFPLTEAKNPNCGLFTVDACNSTTNPKLRLDNGFSYEILQKVSSNKLFVSDHNLENTLRSNRCSTFTNLSPFPSPYISFSTPTQITFFTCTNQSYSESVQGYFRNYSHTSCPFLTVYYRHPLTGDPDRNVPPECTEMQLPAKANSSSSDFYDLLTTKFTLEWNVSQDCSECYERGGQCLSTNKNAFYCSKVPSHCTPQYIVGRHRSFTTPIPTKHLSRSKGLSPSHAPRRRRSLFGYETDASKPITRFASRIIRHRLRRSGRAALLMATIGERWRCWTVFVADGGTTVAYPGNPRARLFFSGSWGIF